MSRKLILDERFQSGQLDPAVWKVAKTLDFFQSYDAYDGEQVTVKDGILALSTQHNANKSTGMWPLAPVTSGLVVRTATCFR